MNLGGWLPTFAFLLRDRNYLNLGIPGTYWVYTGCTLLALILTAVILSKRTVERAVAAAKAETVGLNDAKGAQENAKPGGAEPAAPSVVEVVPEVGTPLHLWVLALAIAVALYFALSGVWRFVIGGALIAAAVVVTVVPPARRWVSRHPLANLKFCCFIFALIPVQTLFTYNWFVLPQYISRAFAGWIGEYYEVFSSLNALLIFIMAPLIAAATQKRKVYNMMILGTFIMAAPSFLLVLGPTFLPLAGYIVLMTIGEAMWQPRFLQYAAEIAPEGRTGQYMGVAQLPWFLTKVLVPLLYSGKIMARYCPTEGPKNTQTMWLIFGCIAVCSCVLLLLMKSWIGKDFKTKAA
jgi:dipeptide/tripeptide permease